MVRVEGKRTCARNAEVKWQNFRPEKKDHKITLHVLTDTQNKVVIKSI